MRITAEQLNRARPELLRSAADELRFRVAPGLADQLSDWDRQVCRAVEPDCWDGPAAAAARRAIVSARAELAEVHERIAGISAAMNKAAEAMQEAQAQVDSALVAADSLDVDVPWMGEDLDFARLGDSAIATNGAWGRLGMAAATSGPGASPVDRSLGGVRDGADDLADDDESTAATTSPATGAGKPGPDGDAYAYTYIEAEPVGVGRVQRHAAGPLIPGADTDPRAVASWWRGLTEFQRGAIVHGWPARIGALDGVPAVARDDANRIVLHEAIVEEKSAAASLRARLATLHEQLDALAFAKPSADPPGSWSLRGPDRVQAVFDVEEDRRVFADAARSLAGVEARLDALEGLRDRLRENRPVVPLAGRVVCVPSAFLLGFDPDGTGRAIVAYGDPDSARDVAVIVPGFNTRIGGHFDSADLGHARSLAIEASSRARTPVSAVMWLGYDPPQATVAGAFDVAQDYDALVAAPALRRFLAGLRATHEGRGEVTLVGHSYGSLVVGEAARSGPLPVRDLVLIGSPGVGVNRARDLHVLPGHVWAAQALNDPVGYTGWFGTPPTSPGFGARAFAVDPGDSGPFGTGLNAHGQYFDPGSKSLAGIADIVVGKYREVAAVAR